MPEPVNEPNGNNGSVTGTVRHLGSQTIKALTPQFLALIVMNVLLLGMLFWYVSARAEHTTNIINQLLQSCLQERNHAQ